jgi:hypothetical protein
MRNCITSYLELPQKVERDEKLSKLLTSIKRCLDIQPQIKDKHAKSGLGLAIIDFDVYERRNPMNTHGLKFVLVLVMSLCLGQSYTQAASGQQCKALLTPILEFEKAIVKSENKNTYYELINEIPQYTETNLSVIAAKKSSISKVSQYIKLADNIIKQCNNSCNNIPFTNGGNFNCEKIGTTKTKDIRENIDRIAVEESAPQSETVAQTESDDSTKPNAACSFEPERAECLIADQESDKVVEPSETPIQVSNNSNEDIYQKYAEKMNQKQYQEIDRAKQKAVW